MKTVVTGVGVISLLVFAGTPPASAQVTISGQFNFSDTYGVNPIGNGAPVGLTGFYAGGTYDSIGANAITPSSGTTVTATQDGVSYNVPFVGGPGTATPDEFFRNVPLVPSLVGSWTLTAANPNEPSSASAQTPVLNVFDTPPLVTNVSLSGDGLAPTVTWTVPSDSSATSETVYVFQSGLLSASFKSGNLSPGADSFTLPSGILTAGNSYSIGVQEDIRAGGASGAIESRSRSFTAEFVAAAGTIFGSVILPNVSSNLSPYGGPIFVFNTPVTEGVPISIDPTTAVGFIFKTGTGDPNFASVELPDVGNPGPYDLYLWNGSQFAFDTTVNADTLFQFAAGGVNTFEILGIAPSVGLNPNSATDFVTQLTFTASGDFTGTMTPVIPVPEPSTWAMSIAGFLSAGYASYRIRKRRLIAT